MNKKSYITPATMVVLVKTRNALMQASVYFYNTKRPLAVSNNSPAVATASGMT